MIPNTRIASGQVLESRSACDRDCLFRVHVLHRSGGFATVRADGIERRVKVYADAVSEYIFALGRYSMAPIFRPPAEISGGILHGEF